MRFVLTTLALLAAVATAQADNKDLPLLAGAWQPTSMQLGAAETPTSEMKNYRLVIDGDKYHVTVNGESDKGTIKLGAGKIGKPKTMDVTGTEGPNKGKTFPAIYVIDDDTLKVCY